MEDQIASRILTQSAQFLNIQSYVHKLHQRGHLVTLYQDLQRIFEIEKETNKIEAVIKDNKSTWKDYFKLFKVNFEAICKNVIDDLYETILKNEESKTTKVQFDMLSVKSSAREYKESRGRTQNESYQHSSLKTTEGSSFEPSNEQYYRRPKHNFIFRPHEHVGNNNKEKTIFDIK